MPALAGWTQLRIETPAGGRTHLLARDRVARLALQVRSLAPTAGPDAPLTQPLRLRIQFLRGQEMLALFEWTAADELRWTQFAAGQRGRWTVQPEPGALQSLQAELHRLGVAP